MEVESFYSSNGFLLPQYHQFYWVGLRMVRGPLPAAAPCLQQHSPRVCSCSGCAAPPWPHLPVLPQTSPITPFAWLDQTVNSSYRNWGTYMPGSLQEPNNLLDQEYCAGANYTQFRAGAWGFADFICAGEFVYMCRMLCKLGGLAPVACADGWYAPAAATMLNHVWQVLAPGMLDRHRAMLDRIARTSLGRKRSCACRAANTSNVYKSSSSGLMYQFTTMPRNFLEADDFCVARFGAHLVSYRSTSEQQEVEGYYISIGEALRACCGALHGCSCRGCGGAAGAADACS
jgi:hypothetical protein